LAQLRAVQEENFPVCFSTTNRKLDVPVIPREPTSGRLLISTTLKDHKKTKAGSKTTRRPKLAFKPFGSACNLDINLIAKDLWIMAKGKNDWSIVEKWAGPTSWEGNLNGFEGLFPVRGNLQHNPMRNFLSKYSRRRDDKPQHILMHF
jgi:hypothetical protein